jgi:hypothetical protein
VCDFAPVSAFAESEFSPAGPPPPPPLCANAGAAAATLSTTDVNKTASFFAGEDVIVFSSRIGE